MSRDYISLPYSIVDVDEDEDVDGRGPYLGILSFTFVVLLCCLYRTYQNDDEQTENYNAWLQSLV